MIPRIVSWDMISSNRSLGLEDLSFKERDSMDRVGFEPTTSCVQGRRPTRLSYRPKLQVKLDRVLAHLAPGLVFMLS